jgi:5-methylcytosine-specific restriction endonuclease McrA
LIARKPYLEANKKKILEYKRTHRKVNRDRYNALSREYSKKNPEKRREAKRKWANKNKLYKSVLNRNWNAKSTGMTGSFTMQEFQEKLDRYRGKCGYCLVGEPYTIDHMTPYSKGGTNYISNIMPACLKCNGQKADLTVAEWLLTPDCFNKNKHLSR